MKDFILNLLEKYGGKISCWAWNKRWGKRNDVRYRSSKTGKYYTIDKKTGLVKSKSGTHTDKVNKFL